MNKMRSSLMNIAAARAVGRIPLVRRLPVFELVILAEVMMLAKEHYERLTPRERRRIVVLIREAKGRTSNLSASQRRELEELVAKAEPKLFASAAAEKLSPFSLRRR